MIRWLRVAELGVDGVVAALARPAAAAAREARDRVADLVDDVRQRGDAAVLELTKRFDGVSLRPPELRVSEAEWADADAQVCGALRSALSEAARRIEAFHRHQLPRSWWIHDEHGSLLGQRVTPLDRVGCYVPGGTAVYPSTVLMNLVPARIAGVLELVVVSPPGPDGQLSPAVLAAARLGGATAAYRVGGAQAVVALAYGTVTIPRVDKIVGPGNLYVALAKRLVAGDVGIDAIAGPSEVVVVADGSAPATHVAADLLAQAEHDVLARAVSLTEAPALADAVARELPRQLARLPRAAVAGAALRDHGGRGAHTGPDRGDRDRQPAGARALGADGRRSVRVAVRGAPRRRHLPGRAHPGGGRGLPRRPQPRLVHGGDRPVRLGALGGGLRQALEPHPDSRPAGWRPPGRTWPRWRPRRGSRVTPKRPGGGSTGRRGRASTSLERRLPKTDR